MILDLQFFNEEDDGSAVDNGADTSSNTTDDSGQDEVDVKAFADIISEKDKEIKALQADVAELKKVNASLLVKVNSGTATTEKKSFDENLLDMVGYKPRKE